MSLKYYRFDCTNLSDSEIGEVVNFLDMRAHTSCISNPQKHPKIFFGFFERVDELEHFVKTIPALSKCVITEAMPD
jgi:hypothetical protein